MDGSGTGAGTGAGVGPVMARGHTLGGVLVGVGMVALIPSAPLLVKLLTVAVAGGGALLPDLDHHSSTASRSLGIITRLLARFLDRASVAIYMATREGADPTERKGGHRLVTHSVVGCVAAGVFASLLCVMHPAAGAVWAGLLGGLLALGMKWAGGVLALASGGCGWFVLDASPEWGWWLGAATFLGALVHVMQDSCTNSGCPLWWPLLIGGRRWRLVRAPFTFDTGGTEERLLITPLLLAATVLAGCAVTGLLGAAWVALAGGAG